LPNDDPDCSLLAKDCRKLVKLVAPPVPPRSATKVSKLDCKALSAWVAFVASVVPAVAVDELALSDEIRLCTSAANPLPGPLPALAPLAPALDSVPLPLTLSDCALRAANRLCTNSRNAAATSLDEEELDTDAPSVVVAVVVVVPAAVVASVVADAAVLAVVGDVAPLAASASKTAAIRPPDGGGEGRADPGPSVLEVL